MQQYFLSPGVYLCATDDHVILLDLRRDKYLGLARARTCALSAWIRGWPSGREEMASAAPDAGAAEPLIAKMLEAGLLTADPKIGREATPVTLEVPAATLVVESFDSAPRIRLRHVLAFLWSCAFAAASLRWRPIEKVVRRVQTRKARRAQQPSAADAAAARELVQTYTYLRPLVFGARERCLFDSLALVEFLSHYGHFPTWVFGVQTGPFAAHSWVQHEALVFNDTPNHVRRFTPILTI